MANDDIALCIANDDKIENMSEIYKSIKDEYNHVIERSNKLEFKISILVAVIGVILTAFMTKKIPNIDIIISINVGIILKVLYIAILVSFCSVLIIFLYLLISTGLQRINNQEIISEKLDVVSKSREIFYYFVGTKYINITKINNGIISKKFNLYDIALRTMIFAIILLLIYNILEIIWR